MADFGIGEHRFGILACRNGRLVERLREGKPILTSTEQRVRQFITDRRKARCATPTPADAAAE